MFEFEYFSKRGKIKYFNEYTEPGTTNHVVEYNLEFPSEEQEREIVDWFVQTTGEPRNAKSSLVVNKDRQWYMKKTIQTSGRIWFEPDGTFTADCSHTKMIPTITFVVQYYLVPAFKLRFADDYFADEYNN